LDFLPIEKGRFTILPNKGARLIRLVINLNPAIRVQKEKLFV